MREFIFVPRPNDGSLDRHHGRTATMAEPVADENNLSPSIFYFIQFGDGTKFVAYGDELHDPEGEQ
jgi:hypothetical protein